MGFVVGDGGTILRTLDGGYTWSQQASNFRATIFAITVASDGSGAAVGVLGATLRTTDSGATWTLVPSGTGNNLFAVSATETIRTAVGDLGTMVRTVDNGFTWKTKSVSATFNTLSAVFFTDSKNGMAVGSSGTILSTTDGGVHWKPQVSTTSSWLRGVALTDANTGTVVGDSGVILRTTDGGATWSRQSSGRANDFYGVFFTGPKTGIAVGASGVIMMTTDGGNTWTQRSSGTTSALFGVSFADANTGTVVGDSGAILRTTDGGATWTPQFAGSTMPRLQAVAMTGPNTASAVGGFPGAILRTTDGGAHWLPQVSGAGNLLSGVWFTDANTGTAVGGQGSCSPSISTILHTTDGGTTWAPQVTGCTRAISGVFFIGANTGWAVGEYGTILHTTTAGAPPAAASSQPVSSQDKSKMKTLQRNWLAGILAAACVAGTAAAQTVVGGTGDPDRDIAAVQAAVDRGGAVVLKGHFSFKNPPARRGEMPDLVATILVSREVSISGAWDEHGQMTVIEGGEIPFAVEAPGAKVRIEKLRFVRPKLFAIVVDAVSGLEIEGCTVENVEPRTLPGDSSGMTSGLGIYVTTVMGLPTPARPGNPGNVSGKLSIVNNQISGVGEAFHGMGIMVVNVGTAANPVDVEISGNTVRDSSLKGINVMQIGGQARVERNTVISGAVPTGPERKVTSGIHCGGTGSYVVTHNVIEVADPNAAGIRVRRYPAMGSDVERATITDNDVTMSAQEGAVFGTANAGIEIVGLARDITVQRNRIRGRARVGMSVESGKAATPANATLGQNDLTSLILPRADGGTQK